MTKLTVIFSEDDGKDRAKIKNAWVYWREGESKIVLRADNEGRVLRHSSGDPRDPATYTDPFVSDEGIQVKAAYNEAVAQLPEGAIEARLTSHTTKQSLSASLAALGPLLVSAGGGKKTVEVLSLAEIRLPKHQTFLRAVAVTTFGGLGSDVHAKNMDKFIAANYGSPGGAPKEFRGDEEKGFREELRRVVKASGPEPIDVIRDIETAAKALGNAAADAIHVALTLHGNVDRIGRRLSGFFLVESTLLELKVIQSDLTLKQRDLQKADGRLANAKSSGNLEDIQAAEEEVKSRQAAVDAIDPAAREMLATFAKAAEALKASGVKTVELQACDAGGELAKVAAFGFLAKLKSFLSANGHSVAVKGHAAAIFTESTPAEVTVWIGSAAEKDTPGTQTSTTSLPLP